MFGKNPFAGQTDRQIRAGLIFLTAIYVSWLTLSFFDAHRHVWFMWVIRGVISAFLIYSWQQGLKQIRQRKQGRG